MHIRKLKLDIGRGLDCEGIARRLNDYADVLGPYLSEDISRHAKDATLLKDSFRILDVVRGVGGGPYLASYKYSWSTPSRTKQGEEDEQCGFFLRAGIIYFDLPPIE